MGLGIGFLQNSACLYTGAAYWIPCLLWGFCTYNCFFSFYIRGPLSNPLSFSYSQIMLSPMELEKVGSGLCYKADYMMLLHVTICHIVAAIAWAYLKISHRNPFLTRFITTQLFSLHGYTGLTTIVAQYRYYAPVICRQFWWSDKTTGSHVYVLPKAGHTY